MHKIRILDSGDSDCIVITADTPDGPKTIVIDGGDKDYGGKMVLRDHLRENNVSQIDLMIVTHLHQDHHGGFANIVGEVAIREAILPYGDIALSRNISVLYSGSIHIPYYHILYEHLVKMGADIQLVTDCCGETYRFGDVSLKCLFPRKPSDLRIPESIPSLCDESLDEAQAAEVFGRFKEISINGDSSIWLLACRGRNIAFLPGDSTAAVQKSALIAARNAGEAWEAPVIYKMTHHGLKFKRLSYYDKEFIDELNPRYVVVTNDLVREKYATIEEDCLEACSGIRVTPYYTYNGTFEYEF